MSSRVFSQRSFEGYLEIDNRESPGLRPGEAGKIIQRVTKKCQHCWRIVVINPDRTRARGYCPKCDGFVCDECETNRVLTGICRPWKQVVDEHMDAVAKGKPPRVILP